jgi:hypothetical protein
MLPAGLANDRLHDTERPLIQTSQQGGKDMLKHARVVGIAFILVPAIAALMYSAAVRPAWADELDDDAAAALLVV